MPNAHQTGDTFVGGTWRARAMTTIKGTASETLRDTLESGNGYYRAVSFISPPLIGALVPADTWDIEIYGLESSPADNAYIRYMIYQWLSTDGIGVTIIPPTTHNIELTTTHALYSISSVGAAFTLLDMDKICLDIEISASPPNPGGPTNYCELFYGDNIDSAKLVTPSTILALGLTSFYAFNDMYGVNLQWRTESELNRVEWIIERSLKIDRNYITIVRIPGKGNSATPSEYSYLDKDVERGKTYYYKLINVNYNGKRTVYGPVSTTFLCKGSKFSNLTITPNPTYSRTTISYEIIKKSSISLRIYNIAGQLLKTLVNEFQYPGSYKVSWDIREGSKEQISAGLYFVQLTSSHYTSTKKLIILDNHEM